MNILALDFKIHYLPDVLQHPVLLNVFHITYFNMLRGLSIFERPFYVSTFLFHFSPLSLFSSVLCIFLILASDTKFFSAWQSSRQAQHSCVTNIYHHFPVAGSRSLFSAAPQIPEPQWFPGPSDWNLQRHLAIQSFSPRSFFCQLLAGLM